MHPIVGQLCEVSMITIIIMTAQVLLMDHIIRYDMY